MKLVSLALLLPLAAAEPYFNILAMDGGGIRGLIPAVILGKMETYAFEYASSQNYTVPQYEGREGLVAMKDIFNMTAGTSTGSILAAGLVYPNSERLAEKEPQFFAADLLEIYAERGDEIFVKTRLGGGAAFFYCLLFLAAFGGAGYFIGYYYFENPEVEQSFKDLRKVLSNAKRELKHRAPKYEVEEKTATQLLSGLKTGLLAGSSELAAARKSNLA